VGVPHRLDSRRHELQIQRIDVATRANEPPGFPGRRVETAELRDGRRSRNGPHRSNVVL